MPYPLPLTRTEAYLAYKAGVIQQPDLKPSLAKPRIGIDDWLAYWTGLKNDYPKNPDGTPKMLQEEEKYIAYLCGVTDTYPEKCLRRVGAYLRYIISARWGRPDHPLNREELYLSLIKTQFIPSGDPSSYIVIDGTTKAPFVDVKMYGDTYQQTYTGKNLLGASLATMQSENTTGTWSNGTYTLDGVTFTPVFSNGVLQRIELSGTATRNTGFRVSKSYSKTEFEAIVTAGETYTLSGCPSNGSPTTYYLRVTENPYKILYTDVGEGKTNQMPSISSGATFVRLVIGVDGGTDATGLVFRPQFEKSATATSYEPYVGGVPSPNPDYPQPIQTVTGLQTVEVTGKNLFDKDKALDNYFYTSTGSKSTYSIPQFYNNKFIPKSNKITMSFSAAHDRQNGSNIEANVRIVQYDASGNFISRFMSRTNGYTFTLDANTKSFILCVDNGPNAWFDDLQIEYGSTATPYEPYGSNEYEINLGSIELCNLDDTYADYIFEDMGDWKIRKNTNRFTFETRKLAGLSKQSLGFVYNADNNPLEGKHIPLVGECSHFDIESTATAWTGLNKTGMNSGGALWFRTTDTNLGDTRTSEEFAQWLVDAGVSFVYALETPTDTTITDQNLIDQLNALKQGGAEEGTTYIKVSATDPNLPAKLYVEAPKYE